ncbi:lytic transglycosylase F [Stappia sp.]|uniref:transglycosylase SLT domain-containing protein n=1 Tax=Stappia sp. TaxID=1870903 RepID=UPI0032D95887
MWIRWLLAAVLALSGAAPLQALETAEPLLDVVQKPAFGDFSEMKKARTLRVLIPYSFTSFYLEEGQAKGLDAEYMREFEAFLNKGVRKEADRIRIVMIPTRRDDLLPRLTEGHGDLVSANLTITPERLETVAFSDPLQDNVREVLVTPADAADLASPDDLAGLEVHTRASSSYFESLTRVSAELEARDLAPLAIVPVDERLEDEDLLEMVATGIVPAIVMDEHKAKLWLGLYPELKLHADVALREGGAIGWAMRKDNPELARVVNDFLKTARQGTTLGNILLKRYYSDVNRLINPHQADYARKLLELDALFRTAGEKYRLDPLLLAAQAFQESRFDNSVRSKAGAVGIMQMLPSTARDPNVGIADITSVEANIEAGAKYMRFIADHHFPDADLEDVERILFALAGYNAGPNRVARVRPKAPDPNRWFNSVEWEVGRAAGAEPIRYVKNIYIYYTVFRGMQEAERLKKTLQRSEATE